LSYGLSGSVFVELNAINKRQYFTTKTSRVCVHRELSGPPPTVTAPLIIKVI